jgi:hypothetical protein
MTVDRELKFSAQIIQSIQERTSTASRIQRWTSRI